MASRLKRILTPEGYVNVYGGMFSYIDYWTYVYALKDYQGNTRVTMTSAYLKNTGSLTYSSSNQIDYYPFGLERSNMGSSSGVFNYGTNPYLYGANEIDRLNGLSVRFPCPLA